MKRYLWLVILCSVFLLSACGYRSLQKEMIGLDRAYIPAFFTTQQTNAAAAQQAVKRLRERWESFSGNYYNFRPEDSSWKQTFDLVDQRIYTAEMIIKGGKDLLLAHEELAGVRDLLFKLRRNKNIKYYLDYLNEFAPPLEAIVQLTKSHDPDRLTAADLQNIKYLIDREIAIWDKVAKEEFNSTLYGFEGRKLLQKKKYVRAQTAILNRMKQAAEQGDKIFVILSADYIQPNYLGLYKMFGGFEDNK